MGYKDAKWDKLGCIEIEQFTTGKYHLKVVTNDIFKLWFTHVYHISQFVIVAVYQPQL